MTGVGDRPASDRRVQRWVREVVAMQQVVTEALTGLLDAVGRVASRVTALEARRTVTGVGSTTLTGTLLAGATRDVVVPLDVEQASATYRVLWSTAAGSGLLGVVIVDGVVSQTAKAVTVRVRNTGLSGVSVTSVTVSVLAVA